MRMMICILIYTGGGVALLYATRELDKLQSTNGDQNHGIQIIKNALKVATFIMSACCFFQCLFASNCRLTEGFFRHLLPQLLQMLVLMVRQFLESF